VGGSALGLAVEWRLSAALHAALASGPPAQAQSELPRSPDVPATDGNVAGGNLDLLMDVELEVLLRFGERSMLLRDVLELDAGSVLELERNVGDPADLLLDGRVIARGEVVVVDGNYGLRVLEVVPRHPAA
jgi:flagellar motor switch protein FliN